MGLELPFGVKTLVNKPELEKYFNISGAPYTNTAQVLSELSPYVSPTQVGLRHIGLTVNIAGVEYWFDGGVADVDLKVKGGGGGQSSKTYEITFDVNIAASDPSKLLYKTWAEVAAFINAKPTDGGDIFEINTIYYFSISESIIINAALNYKENSYIKLNFGSGFNPTYEGESQDRCYVNISASISVNEITGTAVVFKTGAGVILANSYDKNSLGLKINGAPMYSFLEDTEASLRFSGAGLLEARTFNIEGDCYIAAGVILLGSVGSSGHENVINIAGTSVLADGAVTTEDDNALIVIYCSSVKMTDRDLRDIMGSPGFNWQIQELKSTSQVVYKVFTAAGGDVLPSKNICLGQKVVYIKNTTGTITLTPVSGEKIGNLAVNAVFTDASTDLGKVYVLLSTADGWVFQSGAIEKPSNITYKEFTVSENYTLPVSAINDRLVLKINTTDEITLTPTSGSKIEENFTDAPAILRSAKKGVIVLILRETLVWGVESSTVDIDFGDKVLAYSVNENRLNKHFNPYITIPETRIFYDFTKISRFNPNIVTTGTALNTLIDLSDYGTNGFQTVAGSHPLLQYKGNTKYVLFDGTDDFFALNTLSSSAYFQQSFVFSVSLEIIDGIPAAEQCLIGNPYLNFLITTAGKIRFSLYSAPAVIAADAETLDPVFVDNANGQVVVTVAVNGITKQIDIFLDDYKVPLSVTKNGAFPAFSLTSMTANFPYYFGCRLNNSSVTDKFFGQGIYKFCLLSNVNITESYLLDLYKEMKL